jgi:hypothetical protein
VNISPDVCGLLAIHDIFVYWENKFLINSYWQNVIRRIDALLIVAAADECSNFLSYIFFFFLNVYSSIQWLFYKTFYFGN